MMSADTLREIEFLRQRVEELEYELGTLKCEADAEVTRLMDYFDLTTNEARIIRALCFANGSPLPRPVLAEVISSEPEDLRTIDSHIKRIRRKPVPQAELPIDTLYGLGYRLLPETAKRVKEIMAGQIAPQQYRAHFYQDGVAA